MVITTLAKVPLTGKILTIPSGTIHRDNRTLQFVVLMFD